MIEHKLTKTPRQFYYSALNENVISKIYSQATSGESISLGGRGGN